MRILRQSLAFLLGTVAMTAIAAAADAQTTPGSNASIPSPQPAAPGATPAGDQASQRDDVVVVGSQIQGAKRTGALPVTVLGQDRIDATGSVNGDDLFRSLPQAGDVQFQEARTTGNLNDARGDNASINLRSIGTGNTLVLLNGRRVVPTPGTQTENFVPVQTVNTNAIPVGATRRVEVLRDGAAAIYGSDAVAGVVNVVLDNNFRGLSATGRYGWADGTDEATVSLKAGKKTRGGNITAFASYTHRSPLFASERDFAASEDHRAAVAGTPWDGDTAFDNRSTSSPWGAFTVIPSNITVRQNGTALTSSGVFHVEPTSNTAAGCSSTVYNGNLCLRSGTITGTNDRVLRYDENPDRTISGRLDRFNAYASIRQDIGGSEFFGDALFYHAKLNGQREQSAPVSSAPISVPASNYWNPFGPTTFNGAPNPNRLPNLTGVPTTGLALSLTNYRPVDTGPRTFTVTDDLWRVLGGLRGDWGRFHWEGALTYARARTDDNTHNAVSNTLFQQALALSTPAAYNPFNGGSQNAYSLGDATASDPATIRSFLVEVHRISKTTLATGDFKVSTSRLFGLPGGDVGLATGIELRRETYQDDRDPRLDGQVTYTDSVTGKNYGSDILGASPSPDVRAGRTIASAFVEAQVPLVSADMGVPLIRSLDLQLAARDEHYSDFGNVLKPKVAGAWMLFDGLTLRASWSQSFRAPNLPQFYSAGTQVSNTRTDYAFCRLNGVTCSGASTLEVRSGNRGLGPEDATNFSAGAVVQPKQVPGLLFTADYWSIHERNVIGIQGGQIQLLYDYLLRQNGSSNPNVVRLAPAAGQSVGALSYVEDDYFNLNPRTVQGLDFELAYSKRDTPIGSFSFDLTVARLLKFDQAASAVQAQLIAANAAGQLGSGIVITAAGDQLRINGNPKWRGSATATWSYKGFQLNALVNYVDKVYDTGPAVINGAFFTLPSWTTVSAYVQYTFGKGSPLAGTRLRFGGRNLFDREPPLYSSNYGFLGSLHSATGRFLYAEIGKRF